MRVEPARRFGKSLATQQAVVAAVHPGDLLHFKHKGRVKVGRVVKVHRTFVRIEPSDKAGRRDNVPLAAVVAITSRNP